MTTDGTPPQRDTVPAFGPDNRAERRTRTGSPDVPWVGPIPRVGASLTRARVAAAGRWSFTTYPARTPVRVDVVPVIHAREARGRWSARWSGGIVRQQWGRLLAPVTIVGRVLALLLLLLALVQATRPQRPASTASRAAASRVRTAARVTPTRGPDVGTPGAPAQPAPP